MIRESELRWASLISGGGTTMEAMARSTKEKGELSGVATPAVVIASRSGIAGIKRAQEFGIPVEQVIRSDYASTDAYGEALISALEKYNPDLVTLNGFLVKISESVIEEYENRIFNQHPGPVPDFGGKGMYGRRVHAAVLFFVKETKMVGHHTLMTAQRVAPEYDKGAVVGSQKVDIFPGDFPESLQSRSLPVEHKLQIELLRDFARGVLTEVQVENFVKSEADFVILEKAKQYAIEAYPNG